MSYRGDNVVDIKGSTPAFSLDCMPLTADSQPASSAGPAVSATEVLTAETPTAKAPREEVVTTPVDG